MPTQVRRQIVRLLSDKRRRNEYLAALALLAVVVALGVASVLTQQGHAATKEVQVLDCPVTGVVAHAHDDSCYDADGNLVCPLPELEAHVHDDSCYAEERVLVCGLEEGEEHTHTDECYEVERTLVCGLDEVAETHVHGPGCFRTVTVPVDDEAGQADEPAATTPEAASEAAVAQDPTLEETHPEQSFHHEFKDADDNLVLRVDAKAPVGALPKGSTMVATWVDPAALSAKQQDAVDGAIAAKADGQVLGMQAVDISFRDASGAEVEPAIDVTVTLTSALVGTDDQALVVHIQDLTDAQRKAQEQALEEGKTADEAEPERSAEAVEALSERELERRGESLADDQLAFDSGKFSTYVLAVTSLRKVMQASDGATVTVTVDAPAEAGIPQGAELQVREIASGSADWQGYQDQALAALDADEAALARFFDIAIVGEDGAEIQPTQPVQVEIALADAPEQGEASVVHFGEGAEVVPATEDAGVATFDAAGFSVWGVVYTVDFHWTVDGQDFEYNLQGGDAVGLRELLPALGVVGADEVDGFVAHIFDVTFSDPELVAVAQVSEDTTAGALKESLGLQPEYSAELTEEQMAEMDAKQLTAPDWALISLRPFDTEETLTITMTNGETVVVKVTDAQLSTHVITADGEDYVITVTYGPEAGIPDGAWLEAREILEGTEEYEDMLAQSQDALSRDEGVEARIQFSRFFDVSILDAGGKEIEPVSPVSVSIKYAEAIELKNAVPMVVHFVEDEIEVIRASGRLDGDGPEDAINVFEYEQGSFSGIGTIVNSPTIADGKYFMIHATSSKQYALTTSGGTVEVDYDSKEKTVKAKDGTDESTLLWNIKHVGNGYYSLQGDNGKYLVLRENGQIVDDNIEYILPFWYGYDPNTYGSQGDGYSFYNVGNPYDESTWIPLSFGNDLEYTTGGTATRVRLAKYSMESEPTGYPPEVNTYTGHPVDPKEVNDWLMSLFDDMPIGSMDGYGKTAEVYDYENRIYSIDFTAKSNSQGFTSNLDIAFSVDMSNSMLFPKAMTEIGTVDMNQNAVATMLAGREDEVFFVVSDIPNTYTVNAIFYEGGKWKYEDASKWARGQRGGNNQDYVIPNSTTRISTKKDSNNNYYDTGTYTIYTAEGNYVDYVKNNEGNVFNNPDNRLSEMKMSLGIAFNFLSIMEEKYNVRIRVGWNGFAGDIKSTKAGETYNYSAGSTGKGTSLTNLGDIDYNDIVDSIKDAGNQTGGGTRPDAAFDDAYNNMGWDTGNGTKRVLVLITDGAPQGGERAVPSGSSQMNEGKKWGKKLHDEKRVDIVSIGLSTEHIDSADELFQYISATDAEGRKLVYQAKDGDVLRDALMDTLRQMVEQAITVGTIKDDIDPAFYPVSTDGTPLKVNDKIDLNGKLTTDTTKPYGVIGWDAASRCWTVTWSEQDIVWPDADHPHGWHGRVLVKAKENFLGGNDISTNKGQASLDVINAKVKTTKNPDGTWNYREVPFSDLVDIEQSQLETRYMDTPHVNVDELEMTKNDTEWTVYLNTEVDPGEQMEALFNEIKVMKVVTDGAHEMNVPSGQTAKDTMVYDLVPTEGSYSYEEASSDARDKRDVDQAFFYLKDLFSMKDSLNSDFIIDEMTAEQAIAKLLAGEKVEVKYQGYGHGTTEKPVGKIILELKADPSAQVDNLNEHGATPVGNAIEKYILSAEYRPTPEEGSGDWYWNTGSFGTKDRGAVAEDKTKTNTHIINVIKRILTIQKTDSEGRIINDANAGEATFTISHTDEQGDTTSFEASTTGGVYVWDYVVPDVDKKVPGEYWAGETTYTITESKPPKGYASFDGTIPVTLTVSDTKTNVPTAGGNDKIPYNWTQSAALGAEGTENYVTVSGSSDIIISVKNDKSIDIEVIKTDTDGMKIPGAKFSLTKGSAAVTDLKVVKKGGSWDNEDDRVMVDDGVFEIPEGGVTILGLGAGEYTLTETEAPAGYIKTVQPVKFEADRDGTVTYENAVDNPEPRVTPANNNKQYTIQNEPGVPLPNAGGFGTTPIYLFGIGLMAAAATGLVLQRRKRAA